jgi:hypothetical protein
LGYSPRRIRIRWGGARIPDRYRWAAWRGRLHVVEGGVEEWCAFGLEHPEERVERKGDAFLLETDTYGDADGLELDCSRLESLTLVLEMEIWAYNKVGSRPLRRDPALQPLCWCMTGKELLEAGSLRRELGGEGLFVAVERLTDKPLPRVLAGTWTVPVPPGGKAEPYYLFARERDDAKLWTSPVFAAQAL